MDSPEPLGSRLLDVVRVIDILVSPGGDPWKRQQTHASLARYLLEEAYEAYDAIEAGDLDALREELGDVLLQVVLHARLAQEAPHPWSIDDVAQTLADKMVRRNPHVFAAERAEGGEPPDIDEITANWERIKRAEKDRQSVLDGVPLGQPALALAAKVLARVRSAGLSVPGLPTGSETVAVPDAAVPDFDAVTGEDALGELLFDLVARATARGWDPEAALRRVVLRHAQTVRSVERGSAGDRAASDEPDRRTPRGR